MDDDFDVCWKCQADRAGVPPGVPPATEALEAEADAQQHPVSQCPKCNERNQWGFRFCGACGATLVPPEPEVTWRECPNCNARNESNLRFCVECGTPLATLFDASGPRPHENASMLKRYQDGYRVAKLVNAFGQTCKTVGLVLGGLILLGCAMAASESSFGAVIGPIGLVLGPIVGFAGWATGVIISALGQMVKATLDTAVNSSPFLSNEERKEVMSLP